MSRGKYTRTEDIRKKQSETMKRVSDTIDVEERVEKYRETIAHRRLAGKNIGRPKGTGVKRGSIVQCPVCSKDVYLTPKEIKDKKRKCCSRECLALDPVYRNKLSNMDKSYMKTSEYSATKRKDTTPEYKRYRNKVQKLTEEIYVKNIDIINPNRYPRTLCGVDGGWQLDHIKTVREAFDEGLSPEEVAHIDNLRMLPWKENLMRNYNEHSFQESSMA